MDLFHTLGTRIDADWCRANYDNRRLPEIATDALAALRIWDHLGYDDIMRWVATAQLLPFQGDLSSKFGQPPVTLWWHPRFQITALFWTTATTAIHEHRFSGAFAVLAGSSLQMRYRFALRERVSSQVLLGDLALHDVRLLRRGDIHPIYSGSELIHAVFHLDMPSVTIVVRTHADVEAGVQYQYLRPHLAYDSFYQDHHVTRRQQILDLAARLKSEQYESLAGEVLARVDFLETYYVLSKARQVFKEDEAPFTRMVERARDRHGSKVDMLIPVIEEMRREALLVSRRERITDPEHRFLLALLINLPDRDSILDVIRQTYGGEPRERVVQWLKALSDKDVLGLEFDDVNLSIVRHLLEGLTLEEVVRRLATAYPDEQIIAQQAEIEEHCERIRDLVAFRALLRPSAREASLSAGTAG